MLIDHLEAHINQFEIRVKARISADMQTQLITGSYIKRFQLQSGLPGMGTNEWQITAKMYVEVESTRTRRVLGNALRADVEALVIAVVKDIDDDLDSSLNTKQRETLKCRASGADDSRVIA